jgi:hypothetical protein
MKRWTIATPAVVAVLAVWILAGCSSGGSGSPATTSPAAGTATSAPASPAAAATPGTIPYDVRSPMRPGKYATVQFRPPFTFSTTVTAAGGADTPDVANFSLKIYGNYSNISGFYFLRFAKVCAPDAPSRLTAAPDQLLACLVHNPHLRVTVKPAPVTIGGISGQQLDVQVVGKLPGPPSCNGDPHPCVRMGTTPDFPPAFDGGFGAAFEAGYSARIWIFDVHGTPVAVAWTDLTAQFASHAATADKIMQTVKFS